MKKFLIALPLVLIMVLSMIPAFAANLDLQVKVEYFKTPVHAKDDLVKTEEYQITVSEEVAKDEAKLKAEVEKQVRNRNSFPNLNADKEFEWAVVVDAKAMKAGEKIKVKTVEYKEVSFDGSVKDLIAKAKEKGVEIKAGDATETDKVSVAGANAINAAIEAGEKSFTLKKADHIVKAGSDEGGSDEGQPQPEEPTPDDTKTEATAVNLPEEKITEETGEAQKASASVIAYPKCYVNQKEEVKEACPVLCSEIKVQITDVFHGVILKDYTRIYKVDKSVYPRFENIYNSYMKNFFPVDDYQIVNDWFGQKWIEIPGLLPKQIGEDCTINIKVIPTVQKVNVIHVFQDCCKNIDGTYNYNVWKTFVEQNVYVDFIGYQTELLFDHAKAAEFAATRIQKINATDFVFVNALFDDGMRLDGYMTGQVYDLNGKLVKKIENSAPVIKLIYRRAECVEQTEAQVDNATVANNANTTAPATANAGQLPATGAKDVSAFFLSAVALLGLGIFFAKKH